MGGQGAHTQLRCERGSLGAQRPPLGPVGGDDDDRDDVCCCAVFESIVPLFCSCGSLSVCLSSSALLTQ